MVQDTNQAGNAPFEVQVLLRFRPPAGEATAAVAAFFSRLRIRPDTKLAPKPAVGAAAGVSGAILTRSMAPTTELSMECCEAPSSREMRRNLLGCGGVAKLRGRSLISTSSSAGSGRLACCLANDCCEAALSAIHDAIE